MQDFTQPEIITTCAVREEKRLSVLVKHFGKTAHAFERSVFAFASYLSRDYTGGYWEFVELSNGGFYMFPKENKTYHVFCDGNGYEGEMSAETFGIVVSLFALSNLGIETFHDLRDYIFQLKDVGAILEAID